MPRYLLVIANDERNDAGEGVAAEYVGVIKELPSKGCCLAASACVLRAKPRGGAIEVREIWEM